MSVITPTWTDNVAVQAPYAIIKGELVRSTLDLRTKRGAQLFLAVGFGGSTDLSVGIQILVRRVLNNDSAAHRYAISVPLTTGVDPWLRLINGAVSAGVSSFAYDGHTGKTAAIGEKCFFWGVDSVAGIPVASGAITPAHGCEVLRCSKGVTTPLVTDKVSAYDHHDNEYIGLAETFSLWVPGGSLYEVIFDYGGASAGEAVAVMADAQTYDSDTIA